MTTRDDIRAQILASKPLGAEIIDFFGAKIELRQMRMQDVLSKDTIADPNDPDSVVRAEEEKSQFLLRQIIKTAYVPGTNELVFEEGDIPAMLEMPFGADIQLATKTLEKLSEVNFPAKSGSSKETPDTTSSTS